MGVTGFQPGRSSGIVNVNEYEQLLAIVRELQNSVFFAEGEGGYLTLASKEYVYQSIPKGPSLVLAAGTYIVGFGAAYIQQAIAGGPLELNLGLAVAGATFGPIVAQVSNFTFALTSPWTFCKVELATAGTLTLRVAGNTTEKEAWSLSSPRILAIKAAL